MIILESNVPNPNICLPAFPQANLSWALNEAAPEIPGAAIPMICHNDYEIYIHVFGDISLSSDGRLYLLSPGDIAILPPYTIHRLINPRMQTLRYYSLRIPETFSKDYFSPLYNQSHCRYLSPNISETNRLKVLCSALDALSHPVEPSAAKRISSVFELIALVEDIQASGHFLSPSPLSRELTDIVNFLEASYAQPLTLSEIANRAGIPSQALAKIFHSELDTTPISYLQELRLRKARDLLSTTLPLNEVCKLCGFADYSRFIERFRKAYGITPHKLQQLFSDRTR